MGELTQRIVEANDIQISIVEQGSGPLVLLCHGFPESSYSWRIKCLHWPHQGSMRSHQICVAMARVTGQRIDQYTIFHLIGDLIEILDAPETKTAVLVGHDADSSVVQQIDIQQPTRSGPLRSSVPYQPEPTREHASYWIYTLVNLSVLAFVELSTTFAMLTAIGKFRQH